MLHIEWMDVNIWETLEKQILLSTVDTSVYGSVSRDWLSILENFYMLHNPSKLDNVPALLLKYKGHERELLDELCRQYELDNPEGQIVKLVSMVEDDLVNTEDIR